MTSSRGFLSGFQEFLTTPYCLWRMHYHLGQINSTNVHKSKKISDQQRERQIRLQIRIPSADRSVNQVNDPKASFSKDKSLDSNISKPLSSHSTTDSYGLLEPLARMWLINVGLIVILAVISYILSLVPVPFSVVSWFNDSTIYQFVRRILSSCLHISLLLFMELVNMLYLKKICDRISLLSDSKEFRHIQRSSLRITMNAPIFTVSNTEQKVNPFRSAIGSTIMDRLYTFMFFILFQLQWSLLATILSQYWIRHLINAFAVAFLYACYAFEYRWRQVSKTTFEGFLKQIINNWTYFFGYGSPLGLLSIIFPYSIGWGGVLLAIGYPVLVIGALGSYWCPDSSSNPGDEWIILRLLRYFLIVSMRPALWISNRLIKIGAWIVDRIWF